MTSIQIDRNDGLSSSTAIKGPVKAATTANITLSGEQTIDGVAVVTDDRVLVKDQTSSVDNGIWKVSTGVWSRARDFISNRDIKCGTVVNVVGGTVGSGQWQLTTPDPITIGTTSLVFQRLVLAASQLIDEDDMASNSATKVPSQQSVKAYVDSSSLVNARVYGASPSNTAAQNDAAFDAMNAIGSAVLGPIFLDAGSYQTTKSPFQLLNLVFAGPGKVEMSGYGQAPKRSMITAADYSEPSTDTYQIFDGLTDKTLTQMYTFVEGGIGTASTGLDSYQNLLGACQEIKIFDVAAAGHNSRPGDNRDRSGIFREYRRTSFGGQGDFVDTSFFINLYGSLAGQTHFLAGAAAAAFNGGISAGADGKYLQFYEMTFSDGGFEAACIPSVMNMQRTNAGTSLGSVWIGHRVQSGGSQPIDAFYSPNGASKVAYDTTAADLGANKAALAIKQSDRIYLNASSTADPTGAKWYADTPGNIYVDYDGTSIRAMMGGNAIASFATTGVTLTQPLILPGSPSSGLQAATKTYVDNAVATKQPLDATLTALAAFNTNGILTQTAADTFVGRTLTGTANELTVTNGNGVSGNPTISLPSALTFTGKTVTGGTFNIDALTVSSATAFAPQVTVSNTTNDANSGYFVIKKARGSAAVQVGDTLGTFLFQGLDSTGTPVLRNAGNLAAIVETVTAGSVLARFEIAAGTQTWQFKTDGTTNMPGDLQRGGTKVLGARDTGWTAMTGTSDKATAYATGSVTLPQLAGRVMAMQAALTTHGIIGA